MIVVDLGCAPRENGIDAEVSITPLIQRFKPSRMYGFDPWPGLEADVFTEAGCHVIVERKAAWLYDGKIGYREAGLGSSVGDGSTEVPCFDLARWLKTMPEPVVLKMDIEGAEYELLERLIETDADQHVSLLLVEWHGDDPRRPRLVESLSCPVEEW